MKRLLLAAMAAVTVAGPLTATNAMARDRDNNGWNDGRDDRYDRRDDRRDDRYDRRDDRRGDRYNHRDDRRSDRWERNRHNGYSYNGRWYYGPPPQAYYGRPGFYAGYQPWQRGQYLPRYYRDRYEVVDYRYHHLRAPPRGYHYVRDDRGDIILAAIATGLIASIILNN
jgi:Ni/Co efflux regulator RcnB